MTSPVTGADKLSALTQSTQRQRYAENTQWTHAAIYYHDWIIVEATPERNVCVGTILQAVTDHKMMIRRSRYIQDLLRSKKVELARTIGLRIVLEAALLQKTAVYGKLAAFGVYMRERWRKRIFARNEMSRYSMICSGLYVKCYRLATGQGLLSTAEERSELSVTPALLANSAALETINVGWAGISYP